MSLLLLSQSPRRLDLLRQVGLDPVVRPVALDESQVPPEPTPRLWAEAVALAKLRAALPVPETAGTWVAADTIVVADDRILGKPRDTDEAAHMLRGLGGRWHEVVTGLAIQAGDKRRLASEVTRVKFRAISEEQVLGYVKSGESMDKAGAYGIQGLGVLLVERIEGCYTNVVGLPLPLFDALWMELNGTSLLQGQS